MSENGLLNDYQAVIDFWSELDSNYTELADSFSYVVEGTVVGMPLDLYDESQFCMRQPFSFTKNCEPMCIIFQNCEISDNFLCPNEDIKLLMNTCCSLWNDAFECNMTTTTTTTTTRTTTTTAAIRTTAKNISTTVESVLINNESVLMDNELPIEITTLYNPPQESYESTNPTTLTQTIIITLASIVSAVLIIFGVLCIHRKTKRNKSKYATQNSETPPIQPTSSQDYEADEPCYHNSYEEYEQYITESETTINQNYNPN